MTRPTTVPTGGPTTCLDPTKYARAVQEGLEPPCDLWYIDGDHSVQGMAADLRNILPAAAPDGWIFADDCTRDFPGVLRGMAELERAAVVTGVSHETDRLRSAGKYTKLFRGWCFGRWNSTALALRARRELSVAGR